MNTEKQQQPLLMNNWANFFKMKINNEISVTHFTKWREKKTRGQVEKQIFFKCVKSIKCQSQYTLIYTVISINWNFIYMPPVLMLNLLYALLCTKINKKNKTNHTLAKNEIFLRILLRVKRNKNNEKNIHF